jgi:hypothetical protein
MDLKAASHLKRPQEGAQAAFIGSFDNQIEGVFVLDDGVPLDADAVLLRTGAAQWVSSSAPT